MKSIPQGLQGMTGLALVLNGLAHWEFALFDPLYQVPQVLVGFGDLLNASIEEYPLCLACGTVERLPLPGGPVLPVLANGVSTLLVPPGFGAQRDGDLLSALPPCEGKGIQDPLLSGDKVVLSHDMELVALEFTYRSA
jgi:hypothetical protein